MTSSKQSSAAQAALAALQLGGLEQARRLPPSKESNSANKRFASKSVEKKIQVSVQFSKEGLRLLQKSQARLLERGVRRAGNKGTAIEIVLTEWLERVSG